MPVSGRDRAFPAVSYVKSTGPPVRSADIVSGKYVYCQSLISIFLIDRDAGGALSCHGLPGLRSGEAESVEGVSVFWAREFQGPASPCREFPPSL